MNLLEKLKVLFSKIFQGHKKNLLEESKEKNANYTNIEVNNEGKSNLERKPEITPEEELESIYMQAQEKIEEDSFEKKRLLSIYQNIQNGIIKMEDLMIDDMIKVLMLEQEEIVIYDKKIEELNNINEKMKNEIDELTIKLKNSESAN